jgi:hypothetical protein
LQRAQEMRHGRDQLGRPKYWANALVKSVVATVVPTFSVPDAALPITLPSHRPVFSPNSFCGDA